MNQAVFNSLGIHITEVYKGVDIIIFAASIPKITMEVTLFYKICLVLLGLLTFAVVRWKPLFFQKSLPGPLFRIPILGHLHLLGSQPWITLLRWQRYYGKMYLIYLGSIRCVVLNDANLIKEAFHKKNLSHRQRVSFFVEAADGRDISIIGDGKNSLEQRNFVIKCFKDFGCHPKQLEHHIQVEIAEIVKKLETRIDQPVTMNHFFGISFLNALWSAFMGERFSEADPKLQELTLLARKVFQADGILINLAILVPWISKLVPEYSGYNSKVRTMRRVYSLMQEAYDKPLKPGRIQGQPRNFKEAFLDEVEAAGDNKLSSFHPSHGIFPQTAAAVFLAAAETVGISMEWLVLYMATFPNIQNKLQKEIDDKIGSSRTPSMPYAAACILELLRFSSIAPLSAGMHRACEDTEFNSYVIRKDTHVIANLYAVHFNEKLWGDPNNFRPERFLEENNPKLKENVLAFSAGRRKCVGEPLARDEIFLCMISIFQKFNVSCDTKIHNIHECVPGTTRTPHMFKVKFTKR